VIRILYTLNPLSGWQLSPAYFNSEKKWIFLNKNVKRKWIFHVFTFVPGKVESGQVEGKDKKLKRVSGSVLVGTVIHNTIRFETL